MSVVASTPSRSRDQRLDALRLANDIRTRRRELKAAIKSGEADPVELLENPPEYTRTMKVIDLLLAMRGVGTWKANKMLAQSKVSPSRTLGAVSGRQRHDLLSNVRAQVARIHLRDHG